ncbi:hypothetical protein [Thalassotalea euphylliae]|uniref:hypothetical protein n=1 Tax=Thalassotalea euphylliae TaxID=1655234 RepID=UPI0011C02F6B|nr:hypothetical protein [Thalassotalea euphylliae]
MKISIEKIKESLASFLTVSLLFAGGWYYLDQQRLAALKEQENAIKLNMEADFKLRQFEEKWKELEKKEKLLQEQSKDNELSILTLKFIDEASSINFNQQCADDPEHNSKAIKAKALLSLIEAKAIEYGREDVLNTFVKDQRAGIGRSTARCKP